MIDIIVPIYSGVKETRECIESLLSTKYHLEHKIFLINDCTPDVEISTLLKVLEDKRISVLINEKNLGFVKSVNKGLMISKNDVIILNADTVVTNYWIDKLHNAAYSDKRVGTVTSLTNNGTISSVPTYNEDNKLPDGFSIDEFSDLVEKVSNKKYPIIPTGVGHAMYIKRKLINEIGLFDAETFGRGYGEEVDFSYRANNKGYLNILADDTFIYHYGSTSFQSDKEDLIKKNRKKIIKRHFINQVKTKLFVLFNRRVRTVCTNIQNEIVKKSAM